MAIRRRRHVDRVNSFIVVWCGDEMEQVSFDGEVFQCPPIDHTAVPGPDSPYKLEGARDRVGEIIPGTVRVSDRTAMIEGNKVRIFDSDMFVKWVETIRTDLLDRGLFIVDLPEEVEEAKAEGRPIYEASQDERARMILETELFRRRKWEEKGTPAPPSSSEDKVLWAIKHLRERGTPLSKVPTEDILGALSGGAPPPVPQSIAPGSRTSAGLVNLVDANAAEAKLSGKELFAKAGSLGLKLKNAEMQGLLSDDATVLDDVAGRIAKKEEELTAVAGT